MGNECHKLKSLKSVMWPDIPGDGSVYVWDNDLVVPVPEIDGALTATGPLVLSGHTEHNIIWSVTQLERHLCLKRWREWDVSHEGINYDYMTKNLAYPNKTPHQLLWCEAECFLVRNTPWCEPRFWLDIGRTLFGCPVVVITGRRLFLMSDIGQVNNIFKDVQTLTL